MNNQNSWSEREIGMQIGAVIHDAVAICVGIEKCKNGTDMLTCIEIWVDKLFDIGTKKKQSVLESQLKSEEQDKLGTPYDENYPQVEIVDHTVSEPHR